MSDVARLTFICFPRPHYTRPETPRPAKLSIYDMPSAPFSRPPLCAGLPTAHFIRPKVSPNPCQPLPFEICNPQISNSGALAVSQLRHPELVEGSLSYYTSRRGEEM